MSFTYWDILAYGALALAICSVYSEKYRNGMVFVGGIALSIYAGYFIKNPLFSTLQALVAFSALCELVHLNKKSTVTIMVFLTAFSYGVLFGYGEINSGWAFSGSLGLLGLVAGIILFPKASGYLVWALSGILLTAYAYHVVAPVFLLLNLFFIFANIQTWLKQSKNPLR